MHSVVGLSCNTKEDLESFHFTLSTVCLQRDAARKQLQKTEADLENTARELEKTKEELDQARKNIKKYQAQPCGFAYLCMMLHVSFSMCLCCFPSYHSVSDWRAPMTTKK